jgi:hypothetical protein
MLAPAGIVIAPTNGANRGRGYIFTFMPMTKFYIREQENSLAVNSLQPNSGCPIIYWSLPNSNGLKHPDHHNTSSWTLPDSSVGT